MQPAYLPSKKHFWKLSAQAVSIFSVACQKAILDQSHVVDKEKSVVTATWIICVGRNSIGEEGQVEVAQRQI